MAAKSSAKIWSGGDGPFNAEHVEEERYDGYAPKLEDVEDKEEVFVKPLHTYHCHCGQMSLVTDTLLTWMPMRPCDGARLIDPARTTAKLFCVAGNTVYIKRKDGLEQQYRRNCRQCKAPLFYQHPFNRSLTFIFKDALLSSAQIGGIAAKNEEPRVKKLVMHKHVQNHGKTGSVTVSTLEEEEAEIEQHDLAESYSLNARIVQQHLSKKAASRRDDASSSAAQPAAKKQRGTLFLPA